MPLPFAFTRGWGGVDRFTEGDRYDEVPRSESYGKPNHLRKCWNNSASVLSWGFQSLGEIRVALSLAAWLSG